MIVTRLLEVVIATGWSLGQQLLLATVCVAAMTQLVERRRRGRGGAHRQRTAIWRRSASRLARAAPVAAGLAALAAVSHRVTPGHGSLPWEPFRSALPGAPLAVATAAALGAFLVLDAGRLEARGRVAPARRQARAGAKLIFPATVGLVAAMAVGPMQRPATSPDGLLLPAAAALGVAGVVGLLGGLAGKPRPAGWFAAAFYVVGLAILLAASAPPQRGAAQSIADPESSGPAARLTAVYGCSERVTER